MDDFECYRVALARWSARNNFLIDKWTKELVVAEQYDDIVVGLIQRFIADLKAPAFSDFDFKADRDSFEIQSRKRVDATQIELLDGDYVRRTF